jgi:hypothetical protein
MGRAVTSGEQREMRNPFADLKAMSKVKALL